MLKRTLALIASFLTLGVLPSAIAFNGAAVDYGTLIQFLNAPEFPTGSIFDGNTNFTQITSAKTISGGGTGTIRDIYGKISLSAAMTSGNLVGARGEMSMGGYSATGATYLYGSQGKLITGAATINIGSGYACGVIGQMDFTGATVTAGHVAPVISSLQSNPADSSQINGFYLEANTTNACNSLFQAICNATYAFDLTSEDGNPAFVSASAGAASGSYLVVKVKGTAYKLSLLAVS